MGFFDDNFTTHSRITDIIKENKPLLTKYFGSSGFFVTIINEYNEIRAELLKNFGKKEYTRDFLTKEFNKIVIRKYKKVPTQDKIDNLYNFYNLAINSHLLKVRYTKLPLIKETLEFEKSAFDNLFETEARFNFYAKGLKKQFIEGNEYTKGFCITEKDKKLFKSGFNCYLLKDGIISDDFDHCYSIINNTNKKSSYFFITLEDDYINFKRYDSEVNVKYDEIFCSIIGNDYFRISIPDFPNLIVLPDVSLRNKFIFMILLEDLLISKNVQVDSIQPACAVFYDVRYGYSRYEYSI